MSRLRLRTLGAGLALSLGCQGSSLEVLSAEGSCRAMQEIDLCTSIPELHGTQFVHALPEPYELCEVPPMTFAAASGAWQLHPDASFPESVSLRVGWSSLGLHLYAHVRDSHVVVSSDDDHLENGDSIEIYSAATAELHGAIDGESDGGARRIVIAPPVGSAATRARLHHQPRPGVLQIETISEITASYAATLVEDGYTVEALIRWSTDTALPERGNAVGFDFALNIADDETNGRVQQSALGYRLPDETSCPSDPGNPGPRPSCDSRTWCTPTLE